MDEQYPSALPTGSVLSGQYVIDCVLGQGGFGITYRAKDHKTGEYVAIKEFFPDSMATRSQTSVVPYTGDRGEDYAYGKQCFIEEARTLAQFIGNENIVRIYNYFEENGTAYFVMDYIEGMSFDEYIKQKGGRLSFEETFRILSPVMDALAIVHSRGIIHRDVTPDNIYITSDGKVKLLDFGAARYSLGDRSQSLDVVLKHGFAPKEQYVRRGKQGPFTDIYALGASFYFALTGKRPPDAVDRMDQDNLVAPSRLGIHVPIEAEKAILMALNVQPADRFQSMQAFKNAIEAGNVGDNSAQSVKQRFFDASLSSDDPAAGSKFAGSSQQVYGYDQPISGNPSEIINSLKNRSGLTVYMLENPKNVRVAACILYAVLIFLLLLFQKDSTLTHRLDDIEYNGMDNIVKWAMIASSGIYLYSLLREQKKAAVWGAFTCGAGLLFYVAYWLIKVGLQDTIWVVSHSFFGMSEILLGIVLSSGIYALLNEKKIPALALYIICGIRELLFGAYLKQGEVLGEVGIQYYFIMPLVGAAAYLLLIFVIDNQWNRSHFS
ncbi:MAG: serine/threonine protein kinase [Lachnospiraceae bacterium]|nr:serine/threonine protein kinase [Lachnospiraceae bacterium]